MKADSGAGASTDKSDPFDSLSALREFLHAHLMEDIVPFWMRFAVDPAGGLNTCIQDDGQIVSRDKWLWSQWRAVWVFSRLYREFGGKDEWLALAEQIAEFSRRHGWDDKTQSWHLLVAHDGRVLRGADSIYVDGFAIYGLVEYARASKRSEPLVQACETADSVLRRLQAPHDQIPHFPYPVPVGARVHGIPMMFSLVFWELAQATGVARYAEAALQMQAEIFGSFYRPEYDLIVERTSAADGLYPGGEGRACVPGHVIEDMWFQMHIARDRGDKKLINEACRLIKRHLEAGWDPDFGGGLLLAVDAEGGDDVAWNFADAKLWWPQTEALYATLLAYEHCGEDWCLDWYRRVHQYAFAKYPDHESGEWRQRLRRDGSELKQTVALPVKDPFHLPRALIYSIETLDRLIGRGHAVAV